MSISQFQVIIAAIFVLYLAQVLALAEIMRRIERIEKVVRARVYAETSASIEMPLENIEEIKDTSLPECYGNYGFTGCKEDCEEQVYCIAPLTKEEADAMIAAKEAGV